MLDMFPYPSGTGLHVGHPLGFIGTDVFARFKRMTGHNVLHTMGFDAFGLPAEQYAVEHGQHPAITTEENIANIGASCAVSASRTTRAAASPPPTPSTTAGRSGSSSRSSTPGTTPTSIGHARSPSWSPSSSPAHGRPRRRRLGRPVER